MNDIEQRAASFGRACIVLLPILSLVACSGGGGAEVQLQFPDEKGMVFTDTVRVTAHETEGVTCSTLLRGGDGDSQPPLADSGALSLCAWPPEAVGVRGGRPSDGFDPFEGSVGGGEVAYLALARDADGVTLFEGCALRDSSDGDDPVRITLQATSEYVNRYGPLEPPCDSLADKCAGSCEP